jgi:hypothetical protein
MARLGLSQTLNRILYPTSYGSPAMALAKTNKKYMLAKQLGLGESPEAEAIAAAKMRHLVESNSALMKDTSFAAHYKTQELDREAHLAETRSENNHYGPFTSAITNYVPVLPRAMYSYATSRIPRSEDIWKDESN